jgi:hypothetical protein
MRLALIVLALLLSASPRSAIAQYVAIGDTIQIDLAEHPVRVIEGRLAGVTEDSIFISLSDRPGLRQARATVRTLHVLRQRHGDNVAGGWVGMPLGFVFGGVGGFAAAGPHFLGRVLGGVGGAVVGAVIGAVVGDAIANPHQHWTWVAIPWPSQPLPEATPR